MLLGFLVYLTRVTMGRQEIIQHIEKELSGKSDSGELSTEGTNNSFCQHCGDLIEIDGGEPDDYVVHSVPSHGDSDRDFVFYCGPTCFQDAMGELLQI